MEHPSEAVSGANPISGLLKLPQEVYEIILANLHYDKRIIHSLASVNRQLHSHIGTFRFRDVVIRLGFEYSTKHPEAPKGTFFKWPKSKGLDESRRLISEVNSQPPTYNGLLNSLHNLISSPAMLQNLRAIRSITVKEGLFAGLTAKRHPDDDRLKSQWFLVKRIIQQAIYLKSFSYDCCLPFPTEFLTFLQTERPLIRLEILKWYQHPNGLALQNPFLLALAESPSLKAIALGEIQCYRGAARVWFGRIIKESPSLRTIRYGPRSTPNVQYTRLPCCESSSEAGELWMTQHHRLQPSSNTTAPCIKAVEELKIAAMKNCGWSFFPFNEFWLSFLDLSKLRILDLTAPNLRLEFEKLKDVNPFTNLKKLSFVGNIEWTGSPTNLREAVYMFLGSCSLEALAVFSFTPYDIERLLSAQTDTLKFLLIEWYPTATDLYFIRDHCRLLEFLGISAKLPQEDARVCNVLVTFEHLRCLRIRISSLSMQYANYGAIDDGSNNHEDWQAVMLSLEENANPSEDAVFLFWKFIALNWRGKQLPKVAMRGSYHMWHKTHHSLGKCEAFWVVEPKGKARPGSTDADFYRGFDLVGFENYKVASFPDAELDYPKIPMPYADRVNR